MRPVPGITEVELSSVIAYLASSSPNGAGGRGRGGPPPTFPPGPVVARGGAQQPLVPPRSVGPFYPGLGGNAGNYAYPEEAGSMPATRYMSDYGVLASWTKPPYTTLTAYDLEHRPDYLAGPEWRSPADSRRWRTREHRWARRPQRNGRDQGRARVPCGWRREVPRLRPGLRERAVVCAIFRQRARSARVVRIQGAPVRCGDRRAGRRRTPRHERAAGQRHDRVCPQAAVSRPERALSVRPQERVVRQPDVHAALPQCDPLGRRLLERRPLAKTVSARVTKPRSVASGPRRPCAGRWPGSG